MSRTAAPVRRVRRRGIAVLTAAGGALTGAGLHVAGVLREGLTALRAGNPTVDDVGGLLAAAAGLAVVGWLLLGLVVAVAATLGRPDGVLGDVAARVTPALLRQAVAGLLATGLVVGVGGAASAAPTGAEPVAGLAPSWAPRSAPAALSSAALAVDARLAPGWVPERPATRSRVAQPVVPRPAMRPVADDEIVVRRGDTLWSLAARHLGHEASDAQVALEWPDWFTANRAAIGPDPDRLVPGTRLAVPSSESAR